MHLEEDENKDDIFGEDYKNYDILPNLNISKLTGKNEKNETVMENSPNKPLFEKIEEKEFENFHHQTELNKDDKKGKEKPKTKHKKSFAGESLKDSSNILKRKTTREYEEKGKKKDKNKKTKSKMDSIPKNPRTELNYEDIKKENEKKIYEAFNQDQFYDMYEERSPEAGDLLNLMNEEEANAEVNKNKPSYYTQVNSNIPETFNMIISSEVNQ